MNLLVSWLTGLLFGLGLIVAGMGDPAKVIGFLDLAGAWDPSLALVMGSAVALGGVVFCLAQGRSSSLLGLPVRRPGAKRIDRRLVVGSAVFGVGWGLAGICPGPGFVLLGMGNAKGLVFVIAMLGGMAIYEMWNARR